MVNWQSAQQRTRMILRYTKAEFVASQHSEGSGDNMMVDNESNSAGTRWDMLKSAFADPK